MEKTRHTLKIGLLGGSFNPAHQGHVAVTQNALRYFGLDRVWWLVSPGNPLKHAAPAPLHHRITAAQELIRDPRVSVTDIEARIGTRFTADTLKALVKLYPNVQFIWLMGADNLIQFDQWKDWRWIMENVPLGILARPGSRLAPTIAKAARIYAEARVPARAARLLGTRPAPSWCYVNMPLNHLSSTQLRRDT